MRKHKKRYYRKFKFDLKNREYWWNMKWSMAGVGHFWSGRYFHAI